MTNLAVAAAKSLRALHADVVKRLHEPVGARADWERGVQYLGLPPLVLGVLECLCFPRRKIGMTVVG